MAIFGPKPWVNPFEKMTIFRVLELLFFYCLERRFLIIFLTYSAEKKMLEKWPYWDQNHGLKLSKNFNFSTFGTSCFYCLDRRFLNLEH